MERLAVSLALGAVLGVFPVVGVPTFLCGAVAAVWRLNFPALQLMNYVVYPLQIALLWPFTAVRPRALRRLASLTRPGRFDGHGLPHRGGMAVLCRSRRAAPLSRVTLFSPVPNRELPQASVDRVTSRARNLMKESTPPWKLPPHVRSRSENFAASSSLSEN
jgi:hypothetical protein